LTQFAFYSQYIGAAASERKKIDRDDAGEGHATYFTMFAIFD